MQISRVTRKLVEEKNFKQNNSINKILTALNEFSVSVCSADRRSIPCSGRESGS
jgi:hypothetical protein